MKHLKIHATNLIVILFAVLILCWDLFAHPGEAATFDSQIHITNIAMYHRALSEGIFPLLGQTILPTTAYLPHW
jgi:hypothetical protein